MKRRRGDFTLIGAFLFFLSIATMVTVSMLIYGYVDEKSGGDRAIVSLVMLLVIVFLSIVTTLLDLVRRHIMVDKPVEKILSATSFFTPFFSQPSKKAFFCEFIISAFFFDMARLIISA